MKLPRKKYLTMDRAIAWIRKVESALRRLYKRAMLEKMTQHDIISEKNKIFDGDGINTSLGDWDKLTQHDKATVHGYWICVLDMIRDQMEFMYQINGKWYKPRQVTDRVDGVDPSMVTCANGHLVYPTPDENGEYHIYH